MKRKVLILGLSLCLFMIFTTVVNAGGATDNYEFIAGITYNSFDLSDEAGDDFHGEDEISELETGLGAYGSILYWLNDDLGFEVGLDGMRSSYNEDIAGGQKNVRNWLAGGYGKVNYEVFNNLQVSVGPAYYFFESKYDIEQAEHFITTKTGDTLGLLVGSQFDYQIDDEITIAANVNYRRANVNLKEVEEEIKGSYKLTDDISNEDRKVDLSGVFFGLSAKLKF